MASLICIECPNGCELTSELSGGEVAVSGNRCPKGEVYARAELTHPVRTLCSSVGTNDPDRPVLSVRTSAPVDKESVLSLMALLKKTRVSAPVHIGDVIIKNALNSGADIIATDELVSPRGNGGRL